MTSCDIRQMPANEVLKVMKKLKKASNSRSCDITHDNEDDDWFMNINWDLGLFGGWKATSSGRSYKSQPSLGIVDTINLSYFPPHGGNVRFDVKIDRNQGPFSIQLPQAEIDECLEIYNHLLVKYGHAGKNSISYFEKL